MTWELAEQYSNFHLIVRFNNLRVDQNRTPRYLRFDPAQVQPSDLKLNPPESYLFIQDGLIISCGVLYAMCYLFYMARTYKDKTLSGSVEFL